MLHEMLFQRLFTGISPMRSRDTLDDVSTVSLYPQAHQEHAYYRGEGDTSDFLLERESGSARNGALAPAGRRSWS